MPTNRLAMSAANVNGKIYVISGIVGINNATSSVVEEYNPESNVWTKKQDIPTARFMYNIGVYQDKIYIISGYTPGAKATQKIEVYDPNSNTWTTNATNAPSLNISSSSVTYKDNFYFIGHAGSYIYTPSTDTWSNLPTITPTREGSGIGTVGGKIYSIGGSNSDIVYEYVLEKETDPVPQPTGDRAILSITLTTGFEKEFELSIEEVNSFLTWYDAASGSTKFGIDKHDNNKGPFTKRTEYVIFDKILTFEVSEYTTE